MSQLLIFQNPVPTHHLFSQSVSLTQYVVLSFCLSVCLPVRLSACPSVPLSLGNALTTAAVRPFFLGHPVENALLHSEVAVVLTGCKLGLDAKSVIILDFKILCGHDKLQFLGSVYIYVCFLFSL